jgi:hypothetical protein
VYNTGLKTAGTKLFLYFVARWAGSNTKSFVLCMHIGFSLISEQSQSSDLSPWTVGQVVAISSRDDNFIIVQEKKAPDPPESSREERGGQSDQEYSKIV